VCRKSSVINQSCPNPECEFHGQKEKQNIIKHGYFKLKRGSVKDSPAKAEKRSFVPILPHHTIISTTPTISLMKSVCWASRAPISLPFYGSNIFLRTLFPDGLNVNVLLPSALTELCWIVSQFENLRGMKSVHSSELKVNEFRSLPLSKYGQGCGHPVLLGNEIIKHPKALSRYHS